MPSGTATGGTVCCCALPFSASSFGTMFTVSKTPAPAARAGAHLEAHDDRGLTGLVARQEAEETPHRRPLTVSGRGLPVTVENPLDLSPIRWCSGPLRERRAPVWPLEVVRMSRRPQPQATKLVVSRTWAQSTQPETMTFAPRKTTARARGRFEPCAKETAWSDWRPGLDLGLPRVESAYLWDCVLLTSGVSRSPPSKASWPLCATKKAAITRWGNSLRLSRTRRPNFWRRFLMHERPS